MTLRLITGPANAGKTGALVDRFLESLDGGGSPWLLAPTRTDAERLERELAGRRGALVGGKVATLDDVVSEVLERAGAMPARWLGAIERRVALESLARDAPLVALAASSSTGGFADALATLIDALGQAMIDPAALCEALQAGVGDAVAREAADLYLRYHAHLQREEALDSVVAAGRAARLLSADPTIWPARPVLLCGFDDLSAVGLGLVRGLARSCDVVASLPWVEGHAAFEGVSEVARHLMAMADSHDSMAATPGRYRGEVLFGLGSRLFETPDTSAEATELLPADTGSVGVLSAAGPRAEVELVASEVLQTLAAGAAPEQVAVVARGLGPYRALIRQVFDSARIPFDMEEVLALGQVPLGRAVVALARFSLMGEREELFRLAMSACAGLGPQAGARFAASVRRLGIADGRRAGRLLARQLASGELPGGSALPIARWATSSARGPHELLRLVEGAVPAMLVNAHGREARQLSDAGISDAGGAAAVREAIAELRRLLASGHRIDPAGVIDALERIEIRAGEEGRPGRVQVIPVLRARERRFGTVIVMGLNERSFPVVGAQDPFFSPQVRTRLAAGGMILPELPGLAWERYLFYTAVTRARTRLVLSHQSATTEGRPLARSFFLDDVEALFSVGSAASARARDAAAGTAGHSASAAGEPLAAAAREPLAGATLGPLAPATRTKGLASPTFAEPGAAPGTAEYRRAIASSVGSQLRGIGPDELAVFEAAAPGWLAEAARRAARPTNALTGAAARALAERRIFSATQLERYARCPLVWFVEHELAPADIDRRLTALERGSVIHEVLEAIGPAVSDARFGVDEAYTREAEAQTRELLGAAIRRKAHALSGLSVELAGRLAARQLEAFLALQAARTSTFRPTHFELTFNEDGPLMLDDDIGVRGTIDRVDLAEDGRALVLDYKSGKTAPDAKAMLKDENLQVRLYCLAFDELFAQPGFAGHAVAGGYWALGAAAVRGIFDATRATAAEVELDEMGALTHEEWSHSLRRARERAIQLATLIRQGRIAPGPLGPATSCFSCERKTWCEQWS